MLEAVVLLVALVFVLVLGYAVVTLALRFVNWLYTRSFRQRFLQKNNYVTCGRGFRIQGTVYHPSDYGFVHEALSNEALRYPDWMAVTRVSYSGDPTSHIYIALKPHKNWEIRYPTGGYRSDKTSIQIMLADDHGEVLWVYENQTEGWEERLALTLIDLRRDYSSVAAYVRKYQTEFVDRMMQETREGSGRNRYAKLARLFGHHSGLIFSHYGLRPTVEQIDEFVARFEEKGMA